MSETVNPMQLPRITKVTVNIGVGEGGNRLLLAERVLKLVTNQEPVRTLSKKTNRDLGTREGAPIGCKVTLRNQDHIKQFLKDAFWCRENTIPGWNFDVQGNLSFGIRDYTDFPEMKYDPEIGIFGMDINVVLERPGHRVSRRRRRAHRVGMSHRVSRTESLEWFRGQFGLTVVEE
ncbi:MAG: 50S ribosomal protein L5 [Candidatus Thalassarchaeaceae archaeon]|jgi:large subunit ribosomal protein L5|nr:50S ribosomal protein L5 [Candidatus Thalassarchaeaceae archaeon]